MGYNKAAGDVVSATEFNSFAASAGLYAASATGSDAYAITVSPVPNDYDAGDTYNFKADVANTGACTLNVNSLGAKSIKKFGTQDLATGDIIAGQIVTVRYDGTNFQLSSEARPVPFFQQAIPVDDNSAGHTGAEMSFGSNSTGSVFYLQDPASNVLRRYQRDALTGTYYKTHEVATTEPVGGWSCGGIVEIGSYIYLIIDTSGANLEGFRFLAADLTGQTTLTIPAVASSGPPAVWTDGTDVYLISDVTSTTSRRWTISGTTLSAASTATVAGSFTGGSSATTSIWDGTTAYIVQDTDGQSYTIHKLTAINATSFTTTTYKRGAWSDDDRKTAAVLIDGTKLYVGAICGVYDDAAVVRTVINLIPLSKP